jgi:heme exporter protein B
VRRTVGALLRKELALELAAPTVVPAMVLFSTSVLVVFHFALDESRVEGQLAAGVLTVTTLFAAMLGVNRLFATDAEEDGFDGFLLAPVDRTALLFAKAATLFGFLVALQVVLLPVFVVLLLGPSLPLEVVPVLLLVDLGLAIVGTLVSALGVQTRARDLLVPLIALPLLLPVVIGCAKGLAPVLEASGAGPLPGRWLGILALYDLVMGLLAYAVFDFLVED